jgi:hypothetical protein
MSSVLKEYAVFPDRTEATDHKLLRAASSRKPSTLRKGAHPSANSTSDYPKPSPISNSHTQMKTKNNNNKRKPETDTRGKSAKAQKMEPPAIKEEGADQSKTQYATEQKRPPLSPPKDLLNRRNSMVTTDNNNKRLTLPPFGHVLEQALTPRNNNIEKENAIVDSK